MIVGIPKEVKKDEYRIAMLPVGVEMLVQAGHRVVVQAGAGLGSGYEDVQYQKAGAILESDVEDIFDQAEMIVKVKEPMPEEWGMLKPEQVVFTYFHFAANRALTQACLNARITAVAYETLTDRHGRLPLLTPMSEIAGRMSIQEGAKYLEKPQKGRGVLLGGVPGVEPGNVLVLGAGVVGTHAAQMAAGLGAQVTVMDINLDRLRYLDEIMPANVRTIYSDRHAIREYASEADLIIGAVLIPGGRTPILVTREMLASLKEGTVVVDVGVDQGGCFETTRPTTHSEPTYLIDGVLHYCVSNMPGAVSRTSTQALCHATQSYVCRLANQGIDALVSTDPGFAGALNMRSGQIINPAVKSAFASP